MQKLLEKVAKMDPKAAAKKLAFASGHAGRGFRANSELAKFYKDVQKAIEVGTVGWKATEEKDRPKRKSTKETFVRRGPR